MHELVYVSLASCAMTPQALSHLLAQSTAYNREHGITGLLICRGREFMQLIEGEQAEVFALFERIERDERHQQVYRLWDGPIAARTCAAWAMGYEVPEDAALRAWPDGRQVLDEGLFAAGRSSAGQRILQNLRAEFLQRQAA